MKKRYILGFVINLILGSIGGIATELFLIYDKTQLIKITQNPLFWVFIAIIVSIFSKGYLSTLINSITNLTAMSVSYYLLRLIKSGYTNLGACKQFVLEGICVGLFVGTLIYLIKEKIKNEKVENNIPKFGLIFIVIFTISGTIIYRHIHYNIWFFVEYSAILGYIIGAILGFIRNKKK